MAWVPRDLRQKLEWATDSLAAIQRRIDGGGEQEDIGRALQLRTWAQSRLKRLQKTAADILKQPYT